MKRAGSGLWAIGRPSAAPPAGVARRRGPRDQFGSIQAVRVASNHLHQRRSGRPRRPWSPASSGLQTARACAVAAASKVLALALLRLRVVLHACVDAQAGVHRPALSMSPSVVHRRSDAEEGAAPRAVVRQPCKNSARRRSDTTPLGMSASPLRQARLRPPFMRAHRLGDGVGHVRADTW